LRRSEANYRGQLIWNEGATLSYRPDLVYVKARDLSGGVLPLQPGQTIQISGAPLLLETQ
jgi:hypothetical protein